MMVTGAGGDAEPATTSRLQLSVRTPHSDMLSLSESRRGATETVAPLPEVEPRSTLSQRETEQP